jgi:hypothetical protein
VRYAILTCVDRNSLIDLHVHAAPCLLPRKGSDLETAQRFARAGFAGFALKAHFESSVGRAAAVAEATGVEVWGGVVLNRAAGGINADVVAATLRTGGRLVWMPTIDAVGHRRARLPRPRLISNAGLGVPPVDGSSEPAVRQILRQIAAADAALATGHLTRAEVQWLVPTAVALGVRRIIITHGAWRVPNFSTEQLLRLADQGAIIEITAIQYLDGSSSPADLADLARRLGGERCILTSDAGQPANDWAPQVLEDLKSTLEQNGLPRQEADKMVTTTPRSLVDDAAL